MVDVDTTPGQLPKAKAAVGKNLAEAEHHICDADVFLLGVYIDMRFCSTASISSEKPRPDCPIQI